MTDQRDLEVIPDASLDTHFEWHLDEEPDPTRPPVPVAIEGKAEERRPIIPSSLRPENFKTTAGRAAGRNAHRAGFHGVRLPYYLALHMWWSVVGVFRIARKQLAWWWLQEARELSQAAATAGDVAAWQKVHRETRSTRGFRGWILLGELVGVAVALAGLVRLHQWWAWLAAVAAAAPVLAHHGRPADKRAVTPAVVLPRHRVLTTDIVVRAYSVAKLATEKEPIAFAAPMAREGQGSRVVIDLAYGRKFDEVMDARAKLASGLDVTINQVFIMRDKTSERRHQIWIADQDPLAIPAGRTPLLKLRPTDIWSPAPFGLDERGRPVTVDLMWNSMLVGAQPRKGKALALDTPVPTPGGWTTMGDLRAGDQVFDERGQPCRVLDAWPVRYDRPCYEVCFSDGSVIVADAEHRWSVETRASRLSEQQRGRWRKAPSPFSRDQRHKRAMPEVLTTAEMLGGVRIQAAGRANYSVRVAAPLHAPDATLPVPPYTLGAWLGDGNTNQGLISCQDEEIIARIEQEGERTGLNPSTIVAGGCPGYRVYGLQPRLRQIGVLGNKHIPVAYMRASESQRRALLAGLLDTDGYCQSGTGVVYFAVTSERLARDVRHLVSTLGYKSTMNVKPVRFNGRIDLGDQWVVTFTPSDRVFGLARKADRQITSMKASAVHRFITEIRPVASVPVRCVTVDSPNSLYLVGETCIPTHNTFSARLLALFAALDPYARLTIIDGKKSPDWKSFALVADRLVRGTTPMPDSGDQLDLLIDTLQEIKRDIERRNDRLSSLPTSVCPEGKLTREIARDPRYGMPVRFVVLEEFQVYLELPDQDTNKLVANLLAYIVAVGPSAGVIILSSTQKPSGVGSGDVNRLFNRYRDNHQIRFALRCGNRIVSEAVLGSDAYGEGYDASTLPLGEAYRGVGILYGDRDDPPTVRTHLADGEDAEKILVAARAMRQRAGTLSGMATGEAATVVHRDPLDDARSVFYAGEAWLSWGQIADRMRDNMPEAYAELTAETISAQIRAFDVPSVNGRVGDQVLKGAKLDAVETAMRRREITS